MHILKTQYIVNVKNLQIYWSTQEVDFYTFDLIDDQFGIAKHFKIYFSYLSKLETDYKGIILSNVEARLCLGVGIREHEGLRWDQYNPPPATIF